MSAGDSERWAEPIYLDASALVKLFVPELEVRTSTGSSLA